MFNLKKYVFIILSLAMSLTLFIGCSSNSSSSNYNFKAGEDITLSEETWMPTNKENLDKLISFSKEKNKDAINRMISNDEVITLPSQTKVTILKLNGTNADVEVASGDNVGKKGVLIFELLK